MIPSSLFDPQWTFRRHPAVDLVSLDGLSETEREQLEGILDDSVASGIWGVARLPGSPGVQALGSIAALLLFTLETPGPLPSFARHMKTHEWTERQLKALVLDGFLEIDIGGQLISGPRVFRYLGDHQKVREDTIYPSNLSRQAVQHVADLGIDDPFQLSWRLYNYNRYPVTARWVRDLADADAIDRFLDILPGGSLVAQIERHWCRKQPRQGWIDWSRRGARSSRGLQGPTFKLYISPVPKALPDALHAMAEVLPSTRASAFKVGGDVVGVLRPDKLIVYFQSVEDLLKGAQIVAPCLDGILAQGVPFTERLDKSGLLSWGLDPPRRSSDNESLGESWRRWVVEHLAVSLADARNHRMGSEVTDYAMERLRLDGVDVDSWTPSLALFQESIVTL